MGDLGDQLRQIVADLERRFRAASARAELGRRRSIAVDGAERGAARDEWGAVALSAFDGERWIEHSTSDLSVGAVAALAADLLARASSNAGSASGSGSGSASRSGSESGSSLDWPDLATSMDQTAALFDRATRFGGSRIVYRAAALTMSSRQHLFIGEGRDLAQHLMQIRPSALYLAWNGRRLVIEEAAQPGSGGLDAIGQLTDDDLSRAADGALALLTGPDVPVGETDLVLDPSVTALILRHGVVRGLEGDAWAAGGARAAGLTAASIAPAELTLLDDPSAAGAFSGYRFDDEGWPAAPTRLIEGGVLRGPLTDASTAAALRLARTGHGRRTAPLEPARPRPAHLVLESSSPGAEDPVTGIERGFRIEGGISGRGDARGWRFAARARRAREIANGRLTGRSYGPVVLASEVPSVLAAVRAVGTTTSHVAVGGTELDSDRGGRELAVSVTTPALSTRAWLGRGS
jgi:predicted Zn-dependent protease